MSTGSLLPPLSVAPALQLAAANEQEAVMKTVGLVQGLREVGDFPAFAEAVWERQLINPPLLGDGIALPHARTPAVSEIVFAVSRLHSPVGFGPEAKPVRLLFLFGVPPQRISEYLATTAALVRRLRDPKLVTDLLEAKEEPDFLDLLGTTLA